MLQNLPVLQSVRGQLGLLRLNRPQQLNALDMTSIELLDTALEEWRDHRGIGAVLIYQEGCRAFCAGGDVRTIWDLKQRGDAFWPHNLRYITAYFRREYQLNDTIKYYPKPVIVIMDGLTMGGGVGLSVHASHRLATPNTALAMPEAAIGFIPDVGSSYVFSRLPEKLGTLAALTAYRFNAAESVALGLAHAMMPDGSTAALIDHLSSHPLADIAHDDMHHLLSPYLIQPPQAEGLAGLITLSATLPFENLEAVEKNLAALPSTLLPPAMRHNWPSMCPLSQALIVRQMDKAKHLGFGDCLQMEYQLCCAMLAGPNFYEGVRAALVHKDRKPVWNPARHADVTPQMIDDAWSPHHSATLPRLVLPEGDHA